MKISGEQLCGLTKSELYDEILEHRCPNKINVHFTYKDCMSGKARHCCCDCYRINLKGEYEVHLE